MEISADIEAADPTSGPDTDRGIDCTFASH
jgi:hypothetical protein